jgi:DNA-binding MarR family transcriptional regulator
MKVDRVNKKSPGDILEGVHQVMHLFRAEQYRVAREAGHDIAHMEGKLLHYIGDHPGTTLRELVRHFERDKGQLARLVKTLREQNLLSGEGDAQDRRSVRLRLTDEGTALRESVRRQVERISKQAVAGFTEEERRQLATLLDRVRGNLGEMGK